MSQLLRVQELYWEKENFKKSYISIASPIKTWAKFLPTKKIQRIFKLKIEQKKELWERFVQSSNLAENQQPKALLHNLQAYKFYFWSLLYNMMSMQSALRGQMDGCLQSNSTSY